MAASASSTWPCGACAAMRAAKLAATLPNGVVRSVSVASRRSRTRALSSGLLAMAAIHSAVPVE